MFRRWKTFSQVIFFICSWVIIRPLLWALDTVRGGSMWCGRNETFQQFLANILVQMVKNWELNVNYIIRCNFNGNISGNDRHGSHAIMTVLKEP